MNIFIQMGLLIISSGAFLNCSAECEFALGAAVKLKCGDKRGIFFFKLKSQWYSL